MVSAFAAFPIRFSTSSVEGLDVEDIDQIGDHLHFRGLDVTIHYFADLFFILAVINRFSKSLLD